MTPAPSHDIGALAPHHEVDDFDCGTEALNRYIREQARQDMRRRLAAVFVAISRGANAVDGFYALSATSIQAGELPPQVAKKLPRIAPIPATLLGRLAVSVGARGTGLGKVLLFDALQRANEHSAHVASFAVVVDAKDESAKSFYEHFGFIPFADRTSRLFIPMKTVGNLF